MGNGVKIAPIRQSRQYTAGAYGYPEMGAADLRRLFRGDDLRRGGSRLVDGGNLRRLSGGGIIVGVITRGWARKRSPVPLSTARGICSLAWR